MHLNDSLRVLLVHNSYQEKGGEDTVVEAEYALLRDHGHEVRKYLRDNREIEDLSKLMVVADTLWSRRTVDGINAELDLFRPDIIHVHNTFPLISPSIYWAAYEAGVPVVQTLHNFRLVCPQAMLLRNNRICEDCLGKFPWRGAVHGCYRSSMAQSSVLVAMLGLHRAMGTFSKAVSRYIALNEFCRRKFVMGGLPVEKIAVKPHFVDVPKTDEMERRGGLFVGRLAPEKGVGLLIDVLTQLPQIQVTVIGDGPEMSKIALHPGIRALGYQARDVVLSSMRRAAYLLMPSVCYETFGLVALEAFACGLPVIASRLGGMAELVEHGKTGLLCSPASRVELKEAIEWADAHPQAMREMGQNARAEYESKYTSEKNYQMILSIYEEAANGQGRAVNG